MKREVSPLKKHIEESPKLRALREKRKKRRKRILILVAVLIAVFIGGIVYAAHIPRIEIGTVNVSGNKVIDTDDVTALVQKDLEGNYAYVIPHKNAFLYPKKKIIADLVKAFPRFKTVVAYRTDLNTLLVTVTEVRGKALWCGTDPANADAQCYFTDDAGKIVSEAPQYSGDVYPRFYGGTLAPGTDPLGQTFIDQEMFDNLLAFEQRVEALGFQIKAITIGDDTEDSLVLDLGNGATAPVRFQKTDDFATLSANLSAALSNSQLKDSMTADKKNLEYFDLRFTNKVYYKFSDGK